MKDSLKTGATVARSLTVDRPRTIDLLGETLRIYATPELIRDIEQTCLDFLQDHVDAGERSVGTEVSIRHSGATLLGGEVTIHAQVTAIDGRSVTFRVAASDGMEEICTGTHSRFVVNVDKLRARVEKPRRRGVAQAERQARRGQACWRLSPAATSARSQLTKVVTRGSLKRSCGNTTK